MDNQEEDSNVVQQFSDVMSQNDLLSKENRLLESFLRRHAQGSPRSDQESKVTSVKKQKATQQAMNLTTFQKYTIALQEQEHRQGELKELDSKASEDTSLLQAIVESIQQRMNDMRRETYEFKRDLVAGAVNGESSTIMAERIVGYFDKKFREKAALAEKLRQKTQALKVLRAKLDLQVKHKEEQGESLHSIDFHQLQIKNSQFNQKIKERNTELIRLKTSTGRTVQLLNDAKKRLSELTEQADKMKQDIAEREAAKIRLSEELDRVMAEVEEEKVKNNKYKIQQSNPDMPQVLDYINQKSAMYELENAIKNWERKLEIIELAAKRARRLAKTGGRPGTDPGSSYTGGKTTQSLSMSMTGNLATMAPGRFSQAFSQTAVMKTRGQTTRL